MRVSVAVEPIDFRSEIDGLVALCRARPQADPISGALFVFASRQRRSIKILAYDGQVLFCAKNGFRKAGLNRGPAPGSKPPAYAWTPTSCSSSCGTQIQGLATTTLLWRPITPPQYPTVPPTRLLTVPLTDTIKQSQPCTNSALICAKPVNLHHSSPKPVRWEVALLFEVQRPLSFRPTLNRLLCCERRHAFPFCRYT